MLNDIISKESIFNISLSTVSKQEFESFRQWVQEEFTKRDQEIQDLKEHQHQSQEKIQNLEQENHSLKEQIKGISTTMGHSFKNALVAKNWTAFLLHHLHLLSGDSPVYQEYCVEELVEIQQKLHAKPMSSHVSLPKSEKGSKFQQVIQRLKDWFLNNRQKKSYRNQELLRAFELDPKTLKKVIQTLQMKYPNCFEYIKLDSKNKGLFLSNRELFERMLWTW